MFVFNYNKEEFAIDIFVFFKALSNQQIKAMIDYHIQIPNTSFKTKIFSRIISYKVDKEWWIDDIEAKKRTDIARELVAIWKLVVILKKTIVYKDQTVEEFAQERLAECEKDHQDGKINEQTYIETCNHIMMIKNSDEALVNCCSCRPLGSFRQEDEEEEIRLMIICMPCGWDENSKPVAFVV
jgi:CRISPR/Cas system CSM-associated protein Csm3 (group 7 of RAMP superfamily)